MVDPAAQPTPAEPERLLIVARFPDGRYLLVRQAENQPPSLLSVQRGSERDDPAEALRSALELRLGLATLGEPQFTDERLAVRERRGRQGETGPCWLRGAAVRTDGEPQVQPPLEEALLLPLDEAAEALGASRERQLLRAGAELLEA